MSVTLTFFVDDISATLGTFDVIRVERSTTLETGPFAEITAPTAAAAQLLGGTGTFNVSGLSLQIIIDQNPAVTLVFTGTDPLTTDQVVAQINSALGATIAANVSNQLRFTSTLTGTISLIEIVGGTAVSELGLTDGQRDVGEDAYIPLVTGVQSYPYTDNDGQSGYFYRIRFFNTTTQVNSVYSAVFLGAPGSQISLGARSLATVDLVDVQGIAVPNARITILPLDDALIVESRGVAIANQPVTLTTDNAGHAEALLVRGARVRVLFEGTSLIRDIVVPDTTTFDLLALVSSSPDIFTSQAPVIPAAPRRTT